MKIKLKYYDQRTKPIVGLLFTIVFAVMISSCGENKKTPVSESGSVDSTTAMAAKDTAALIEPYTLTMAAERMSAYLKIGTLRNYATTYSYGGVFPVNLFDVPPSKGILLWFCYDSRTKDFFLALEHFDVAAYDTLNLPNLTQSDRLFKPSHVFKYPSAGGTDVNSVKQYVVDENYSPEWAIIPIPRATVDDYIRKFRTVKAPYCKYDFSFVCENKEGDLRRFLNKARGGYVRYYFAYQERDERRDLPILNKIRVVFVAVDAQGRNRVTLNAPTAGAMIQSSWPPPPWN